MAIAILYRQEARELDFGEGHPYRGDRYDIFYQFLQENLPEDDNYQILRADWATDDDLLLICQREYIDFTRDYYRAANLGLSHTSHSLNFIALIIDREAGRERLRKQPD